MLYVLSHTHTRGWSKRFPTHENFHLSNFFIYFLPLLCQLIFQYHFWKLLTESFEDSDNFATIINWDLYVQIPQIGTWTYSTSCEFAMKLRHLTLVSFSFESTVKPGNDGENLFPLISGSVIELKILNFPLLRVKTKKCSYFSWFWIRI